MDWFTYEVGDTVETPIGDAIIITKPFEDTGCCIVSMLNADIEDDKAVPAGRTHELTTFQFNRIIKKRSEEVNFLFVLNVLESFIRTSLQCDPKSLIPVLQSATGEKWEYHNGDCCNKGHFIRTGVKL